MNDEKISFIVPSRDRDYLIPGLLHAIKTKYQNFEIIIAHQADKKLFRHGQLRNLGYKKSHSDLVVFMDVDIRFLEDLDFREAMNKYQHPLVMFNMCQEIREDKTGVYTILYGRVVTYCIGRLLCFTREQFESCEGYSNLLAGYGWEDNNLLQRANMIKVPGRIGHVYHEYQRNTTESQHRNRSLHQSDVSRDYKLDGFRQTIAEESLEKLSDNVFKFNFWNIRVPEDFAYKELLPNG